MKYMGSKARFAMDLLALMEADRRGDQWYVEPFAGGMNSLCKAKGHRLGSDVHPYLIAMWEALLSGWSPHKIKRDEYQDIRKTPNKYPPHLVGWAGFNCSYAGKWFGGFAGEVRTRAGTVRDYQQEAIRNVARQTAELSGARLVCSSYLALDIPPKSLIYCDPPYAGTTGYADAFDHEEFWDWAEKMVADGHSVYVSEYAAPSNWETIWQKTAASSLSANGRSGGNKQSTERLFRCSI